MRHYVVSVKRPEGLDRQILIAQRLLNVDGRLSGRLSSFSYEDPAGVDLGQFLETPRIAAVPRRRVITPLAPHAYNNS